MTSSARFQAAFSENSSSEVDESATTHLGCGGSGAEFWGILLSRLRPSWSRVTPVHAFKLQKSGERKRDIAGFSKQ
ncbi:hypothetical protein SOVF_198200 [Spinacia oleracea]|nr:hypothetical protein SOVF_198200 [Spinacia oleracea]